jgi:hypothetical protein
LEILVRLQITPRHQRVSHADGRGAAKRRFDIKFIIFFEKTAGDGVQNVLPVVVPELLRETLRDFVQLRRHIILSGTSEPLFQRR